MIKALTLVVASLTTAVEAAVAYDSGKNVIWVTDFPEEQPATMETILAADREHGWGKVSHDAQTDTYTVDAGIWIGDDKTPGTFVQIGDGHHPKVTVIVRGTVWIRPPKKGLKRPDGCYAVINRLTLGSPDSKDIRAVLKIACEKKGQHSVYIGYRSKRPKERPSVYAGDLHVYNSTITAAIQDREHMLGAGDYQDEISPGWYGSDIRLIDAILSWGVNTYGARAENAVIEGSTFEHCSSAVCNGRQYLRNCVLRHLDTALSDGGGLDATAVGCVFEGNQHNWTLFGYSAKGVVLIDCKVGQQERPFRLLKNKVTPEQIKRGYPQYPSCVERHTLLLKVVDGSRNPVPDAIVTVACEDDPEQVTRGACFTGGDGMTPPVGSENAIIVTTKKTQATDEPGRHIEKTFTYQVTVRKKGFKPTVLTLCTAEPLRRPLPVVLTN